MALKVSGIQASADSAIAPSDVAQTGLLSRDLWALGRKLRRIAVR